MFKTARRPVRAKMMLGSALFSLITTGLPGYLTAQTAADEDVYTLSDLVVSDSDSSGYTASNSITGTRIKTPIEDVPLNIQVFTNELATDFLMTSQVDLERYNASLVNNGDDMHSSNVIQQAYNGFIFRGFVQNWSLRDGVRQYDPIDTQGLSRVEIVKGPGSAFYGLTYPGGVMNAISKSVVMTDSFGEVSLTASDHGYRGTMDLNVASRTDYGVIGVRYNGAYEKTEDHRAHSEGKLDYQQVNLAIAPAKHTLIEFLYETGFREHPNSLGYFTMAGADGAEIPLQAVHPEIPWDWNWATGNMRDLKVDYYRAKITQEFDFGLSVTAYAQYYSRDQTDSQGWDASGGGGSAASWDMGSLTTGWINQGTPNERIDMAWHYRDWTNNNRAYGITALYEFETGDIASHIVSVGAHAWRETFLTHRGAQTSMADTISFPIRANIDLSAPSYPPANFAWDTAGGFGHEANENEYYFVNWVGKFLDDRLQVTGAINQAKLNLEAYGNGNATVPNITEEEETSPLLGATFDVTKEFSIFGVYSTSIFPTTDKNDFEDQLPPVKGTALEFGTKFNFLDGKLSGTISYYIIQQEGGSQRDPNAENLNKQIWDGLTPVERAVRFPGVTNRADLLDRNGQRGDLIAGMEQESKGFEIDIVYQPIPPLQLIGSFAHNNVEITDATDATQIGRKPNSGAVENQFSFITKYTFLEGPAQGLFLGLGGSYNDGIFQGYIGDVERNNPSTFYLEAMAGYDFDLMGIDSSVRLNVKNITQVDEYVGWVPSGQAGVVATDRYEVPTKTRFSLTYIARF